VAALPAYPRPAARVTPGAPYKKRTMRQSVSLTCPYCDNGAFPLKKRGFADNQNSLLAAILGYASELIRVDL
jgi:hypothetical protein